MPEVLPFLRFFRLVSLGGHSPLTHLPTQGTSVPEERLKSYQGCLVCFREMPDLEVNILVLQ